MRDRFCLNWESNQGTPDPVPHPLWCCLIVIPLLSPLLSYVTFTLVFLEFSGSLASVELLVSNPEEFTDLQKQFRDYTSEEWYKTWHQFDLLVYTM